MSMNNIKSRLHRENQEKKNQQNMQYGDHDYKAKNGRKHAVTVNKISTFCSSLLFLN